LLSRAAPAGFRRWREDLAAGDVSGIWIWVWVLGCGEGGIIGVRRTRRRAATDLTSRRLVGLLLGVEAGTHTPVT
jgi:hypothetical protein